MIERLIQSVILAQRPRMDLVGWVIIATALALFMGIKAFLIQKGWILSDSQKRRQRRQHDDEFGKQCRRLGRALARGPTPVGPPPDSQRPSKTEDNREPPATTSKS